MKTACEMGEPIPEPKDKELLQPQNPSVARIVFSIMKEMELNLCHVMT